MKGSAPILLKSLAFRMIIPVIAIVLFVGIAFYTFVLRPVSDFADENIREALKEKSYEINSICDRNLNELLLSGMGGNENMIRIKKGLTVGMVEDFMQQNNLAGFITEHAGGNKKILLSVGDLSHGLSGAIERTFAENSAASIKYAGEKYYLQHAEFSPWGWHILITKHAAAYSVLLKRVNAIYGITGALLLLSMLLLLFYLRVTVKQPIGSIIARLEKGEKPDYKGIAEFEYLSAGLRAAMEAKDAENRILNNVYHIAASRRGEEFFDEVAIAIGRVFSMNSLIARVVPGSEDVHVVAMYDEGKLRKGLTISLKGSPCEHVVEKKHMCVIEKDAYKEFPEAEPLNRVKADSYIGIAIFDRKGNVIGVLNAFGKYREFTESDIKVFQTIGQMAATEFEMLEKEISEERMREELFQSQKLEALGTLAGGIAHDFNNMLQGVLGYASLLKMKISETDPIYNALSVIESSAEKAGELTRQLLDFARKGKYVAEPLNISRTVEEVYKIIARTFDRSIEIKTILENDIWTVEGDRSQLEHVVLNLCLNARDAMPAGGELNIRTLNVEFPGTDSPYQSGAPGKYAAVRVSDTGIGMDEGVRKHIFEPFFTTKEKGKGTGMGLAMVYGVVKNHGGFVTVESEIGKGSTFTIYLPAVQKKATDELPGESLQHGRGAILVVDDEDFIRAFAKETLERLGYEVMTAADGQEAVAVFTSHTGRIDLVILDLVMPNMGGEETFYKLKAIDPHLKVLISSGYGIGEKTEEMMKDPRIMGFVQKPYNIADFAGEIKAAISSA